MGRKARDAAGAMGRAASVLVEQAPIPQLLENPPAGFDVVVFQRHVGVFHIDPVADAVGHHLPLFDVPENALAAALVEFGDAEFLDFPLGRQTKFLFNLELNRQAVGVPTALADYTAALHGAVPGDDVLEYAGQDVVNARAAVGGGRPFVHHEQGSVGPFVGRTAEHVLLLPVFQNLGVQVGEIDSAGNHVKHSRHT